ncbi:MAG: hypothetical protein SOV63_09085, partial [Pyramidobacter porci]|uniref:hypothetical protein n=1 Tax=Pyramidobacter porci TaxID=2605789 RepID=UPI002A75DED3
RRAFSSYSFSKLLLKKRFFCALLEFGFASGEKFLREFPRFLAASSSASPPPLRKTNPVAKTGSDA